jgi:hypothetical protein
VQALLSFFLLACSLPLWFFGIIYIVHQLCYYCNPFLFILWSCLQLKWNACGCCAMWYVSCEMLMRSNFTNCVFKFTLSYNHLLITSFRSSSISTNLLPTNLLRHTTILMCFSSIIITTNHLLIPTGFSSFYLLSNLFAPSLCPSLCPSHSLCPSPSLCPLSFPLPKSLYPSSSLFPFIN